MSGVAGGSDPSREGTELVSTGSASLLEAWTCAVLFEASALSFWDILSGMATCTVSEVAELDCVPGIFDRVCDPTSRPARAASSIARSSWDVDFVSFLVGFSGDENNRRKKPAFGLDAFVTSAADEDERNLVGVGARDVTADLVGVSGGDICGRNP